MTEKQLHLKVRAITVFAVVLVLSLVLYILVQLITLSNLNASKNRLSKEFDTLNEQAQTLEEEIEYRNSRTYIEQYARENLGLGYSNENRYIVEEE